MKRLFKRIVADIGRARRGLSRPAALPRRPQLESLEDRLVLSPISAKYAALGGPSGILGKALTGELPTPYGGGLYQEYQHGAIFWSKATGAHDLLGPGLYGDLEDEFWATGKETGAFGTPVEKILGLPTSDETELYGIPVPMAADFQGGVIEFTPATGAHVLYGAVLAKYNSLGGYQYYGFPTTDEANVPGVSGARVTYFENGSATYQNGAAIFWSAATDAHTMYDANLFEYFATANEKGYDGRNIQTYLGAPTTDETITGKGDGKFNFFKDGLIISSAASGAHVVYGAILAEYANLGYEQSPLGYPTTDEATTGSGNGRFNFFQNGIILWSAATGQTHEVHGAINAVYAHMGYDTGPLGYPTTDETTTGKGDGRFNFFQNGIIIWSPATGAYEVHGAIFAEYASLGYEQSVLGYPTTDETTTGKGDGRFNFFQNGIIIWSPATGAHEVDGAIAAEYASLGYEQSFLGYPTSDVQLIPSGAVCYFQNGKIVWTPQTGAYPVQAVPSMHFHWDISFDDSTPVGGWADLTVNADGSYELTGALHDSGALSYNPSVVFQLVDDHGQAYEFRPDVPLHMAGTFESGSRDATWDTKSTDPDPTIAANWARLEGCTSWGTWSVKTDWNSLVNQLEQAAGVALGVAAFIFTGGDGHSTQQTNNGVKSGG